MEQITLANEEFPNKEEADEAIVKTEDFVVRPKNSNYSKKRISGLIDNI